MCKGLRAVLGVLVVTGCTVDFPARSAATDAKTADAGQSTGDAGADASGGASPPADLSGSAPDAGGRDAGPDARLSGDAATTDSALPTPDSERTDAVPPLDSDGDSIEDPVDNCPRIANPDQVDSDIDHLGDACDPCPEGGEPIDSDGDGVLLCEGDCDDHSARAFPDALEFCDGIDNDCDGDVDEDFAPELALRCAVGQGACERESVRQCAMDGLTTACAATPGEPAPEICNDVDDDCNGATDEGVAGCCQPEARAPCGTDVGECTPGEQICTALQVWGPCEGSEPRPELCDGLDNDCDGTVDNGALNACRACGLVPEEACDGLDNDCDLVVDEGFDLEAPCEVGAGTCRREGIRICDGAGAITCSATAGTPTEELCNALDDDCDGRADEDLEPLGECSVGQGLCLSRGTNFCTADGEVVCGAVAGEPSPEACTGLDDDCDGETDEGFDLGQPCTVGTGACAREGHTICGGLDTTTCDATPGPPEAEGCNGLDDDCDGEPDDGAACGPYLAQHCRVWLVWADNNGGAAVAPAWDACPASAEDEQGEVRCTSTQFVPGTPSALFWDVHVQGGVDGNDRLGVGFTCDDGANAPLAAWINRHCSVFLGWADFDSGSDNSPTWAGCPAAAADSSQDRVRCTSSAGDGLFHALALTGIANADDDLGVAFRCDDPDQPNRAASVQAAVNIWLAFDGNGSPTREGAASWDRCPAELVDNSGPERCVASQGDGRFHKFDLTGDPSANWSFGIGLSGR